MSDVSFKITGDNTAKIIKEKDTIVQQILESWGTQAESHAKNNLTASGHIDTGLLRNSITYAVSGGEPKVKEYAGNRASKYGGSDIPRGGYSGSVPGGSNGEAAVYIGTNVQYAPYIEMGTTKISPTHFLKNAIENFQDEYKRIAQDILE